MQAIQDQNPTSSATDTSEHTNCRIQIHGALHPLWADYVAGFTLKEAQGQSEDVTVLSGCVPDQSALLGIIMYLNQFSVAIQRVEWAQPLDD